MEISGGPKRNVWSGGNGIYKYGVEEIRSDPRQGKENKAGKNRYVAVKVIKGDMGWSSSRERGGKAILNFKVRLKLMGNSMWVKKVGQWWERGSVWGKCCRRVIREYNESMIGY